MKSIKSYINEALDIENLFWKIDTWFMNRDDDKAKFIELVSLYKNKKANKQDVENWIIDNNINIKEFVNFLDEDVSTQTKDYMYQLCKIIDSINANKSKKITVKISESTTSQKNFWAEQLITSLTDSKASKDTIKKMFDNLDMDLIKSLSKYLNETDLKNYVAYCPANDEFIGDKNRDKVINQISEYIYKFIANK